MSPTARAATVACSTALTMLFVAYGVIFQVAYGGWLGIMWFGLAALTFLVAIYGWQRWT